MKAINIQWDVDYEEDLEDLPTEIEIPNGVTDEEISDYLSDATGFCHYGFELKEEKPMKKFEVVIHYEGSINYEVEAQTEDEAKRIAEMMFGDESDSIIAAEIADCGVCDCWEIDEEGY